MNSSVKIKPIVNVGWMNDSIVNFIHKVYKHSSEGDTFKSVGGWVEFYCINNQYVTPDLDGTLKPTPRGMDVILGLDPRRPNEY